MTEIVHLTCDRCGKEVENDDDRRFSKGWAHVAVDLDRFHFCPECWQKIRRNDQDDGL
jgi:endogenous inhibitor of DNA gyrase (YacG/DUF329 family)